MNTYLCNAEYPATSYAPPEDDDSESSSVWKNKSVIGALSGGVVGALIIGIIIGAVSVYFTKKRNNNQISPQPLITTEK